MKIVILIFTVQTLLLSGVGKIVAIKGEVFIERGSDEVSCKIGTSVENGDQIITQKQSKAQIIFVDGTVITVGQKSSFSIEDYLYRRGSKSSSSKFRLHSGILKSITGRIGKLAPERFRMRTKTSTIGVRGTQFIVATENDIDQIACLQGAITVESGGSMVDVDAGMFLSVADGENLRKPKKLTKRLLKKLNSSINSNKTSSSRESESSDSSIDRERERSLKSAIDNTKSSVGSDIAVEYRDREVIHHYDPSKF